MVRKSDLLFQPGPVIRDLSVPDEEVALRPARSRRIRPRRRLPGGLYGTVLAAWTLGLVFATVSLFENAGLRPEAAGQAAEPKLPPVASPPPLQADAFREAARR